MRAKEYAKVYLDALKNWSEIVDKFEDKERKQKVIDSEAKRQAKDIYVLISAEFPTLVYSRKTNSTEGILSIVDELKGKFEAVVRIIKTNNTYGVEIPSMDDFMAALTKTIRQFYFDNDPIGNFDDTLIVALRTKGVNINDA